MWLDTKTAVTVNPDKQMLYIRIGDECFGMSLPEMVAKMIVATRKIEATKRYLESKTND